MEKFDINLKLLKNKYINITKIINNIQNHLNLLYEKLIIDNKEYIYKLNELFDITKNINNEYNNIIKNNINENDLILLDEILNKLIIFIKNNGYINIIESLKLLYNYNNIDNYINEINDIFIITNININEENIQEKYKWIIPIEYKSLDLLKQLRILIIKIDNKIIKIEGFFKIDKLNIHIKTCDINNEFLKIKRNEIIKNLEGTINKDFISNFIKYDYLGNIYCINTIDYIEYIKSMYKLYNELIKTNFIINTNIFLENIDNIKQIYNMILLLLMGNNDNIDMANLLLDLLKEKKKDFNIIYNIIINNLSYYLCIKLKKSSYNIKTEIEKLKLITNEDLDFKKILLTMKNIPNNVKKITLEKIEEMKSFNSEYYKQSTFVKHIINYPWILEDTKYINMNMEEANHELIKIENKLNDSLYGHDEVKKTLLRIIGKWITNPNGNGSYLGLVGPPGIGKTLIAKSIGEALDIPFSEITLGGQNDGELLHGHSYTYAGSQPGLIIKKMVEMGKARCILYFDELDKTNTKNGLLNEITSILIHLTDPNMNKTFQDRFFQGINFPLDKVIMIFSYNDSNLIDPILLDRLKEIHIKAYTIKEKVEIVKKFIIPEISKSIGLNEEWINLDDDIIEFIIDNYTNEAGVRSIKRYIEKIFLEYNILKIKNNNLNISKINKHNILNILKQPNNDIVKIHNKPMIGLINGLYATSNGYGGILPIQIYNNISNNKFDIKITGNHGNIMKESIYCSLTIAIDYIRRNEDKYNINNIEDYINQKFKYGFHIHTPSIAIPKDGPSAGIAFTCCFISRILNKKIKNNIGITGEIELTGKLLKIGNLDYKLIGAKKAGINIVYIPKDNDNDLETIINKHNYLLDNNFQVISTEYIDDIIDDILID
jgi:ATP-dependent Lon protease